MIFFLSTSAHIGNEQHEKWKWSTSRALFYAIVVISAVSQVVKIYTDVKGFKFQRNRINKSRKTVRFWFRDMSSGIHITCPSRRTDDSRCTSRWKSLWLRGIWALSASKAFLTNQVRFWGIRASLATNPSTDIHNQIAWAFTPCTFMLPLSYMLKCISVWRW